MALKEISARPTPLDIMQDAPVIPVIVLQDRTHAVAMARALVAGGIRMLEVTLRTPVALGCIEAIAKEVPEAVVGAGNGFTPSGHAPWILRLDAGGALLWHRAVADVWGDLGAVAQTADGQLVVVGRVAQDGFPSNDLWCARIDAGTGRSVWQRAYEGDSGDFGSAVLPEV